MKPSALFRPVLAIVFLLAGLAQSARADIVTVTGDTTGSPTFDRPLADFTALSTNGIGSHYDIIEFTVAESGEYAFYGTGLFDTFLFLYYGFDPATPLMGGLAASDDLFSANSSGFADELIGGEEYVLVMAGFNNEQFGAYSVTITGPGAISLVPEPASWLMLGIGVLGLALCRRVR
ncbi:PEP-CTERM sorting domain-containing protein [Pseudoduganella sp. SL102]|uniref:PEP-CTERM sorting domain-containing protein n=1 Tax=Pseudoduganella sp. SL102 TaxID=2995154 RepID=UPI00248C96D6|nr:PEP-CTERM sorting domain-containing protein [Pseudoduganella sp. SL102]WBS05170.1 PEP-CTERM sorting domain-containing protein [Pseudoduganella sp. SL102]